MKCCVQNCGNCYNKVKKLKSAITFHRFPIDANYCKEWLLAIGEDVDFNISNKKICSEHFTNDCFIGPKKHIRISAIPTLKLMSSPTTSSDTNSSDFFIKEFPAIGGKKKRSHVFPHFRWTDETTITLLESIIQNENSFEQPTARYYYMDLIKKYPKLSWLDWNKIKHKMRNLRVQYIKAAKWQLENISILSDNDLQENILKICPLWSYCDQIFKHKLSDISLLDQVCKESLKSNDSSMTSFDFSINEYKSQNETKTSLGDKKKRKKQIKQSKVITNEEVNNVDVLLTETENCAPFENHFVKPEKSSDCNGNRYLEDSRIEAEIEFQREKLEVNAEIEKEKLQLQRESLRLEHKKLEIEKSKIELEKHKIDVEFKLKQEQIASEERIRKYEIEYKYKI